MNDSKHNYYIYIVTNHARSAIYIGVTNNLIFRIKQHKENRGLQQTWAGRKHCYHLVYYEWFQYINDAIKREKELKGWSRKKKNALIASMNPKWNFLEAEVWKLWVGKKWNVIQKSHPDEGGIRQPNTTCHPDEARYERRGIARILAVVLKMI